MISTRFAAIALLATPAIAQTDPKIAARIDRVLTQNPIIDGHNDLAWEIRDTQAGDGRCERNPEGDRQDCCKATPSGRPSKPPAATTITARRSG